MKTLITKKKKRQHFTLIECHKCNFINKVISLLQYPNNKNKYCEGCGELLF